MKYPRGRLLLIVVVLGLAIQCQTVPATAAMITEADAAALGRLFDRALEERKTSPYPVLPLSG